MTGLKRALWPSVGDGGKYGHVLFIKILISWRILEGPESSNEPSGQPSVGDGLSNKLEKGKPMSHHTSKTQRQVRTTRNNQNPNVTYNPKP